MIRLLAFIIGIIGGVALVVAMDIWDAVVWFRRHFGIGEKKA